MTCKSRRPEQFLNVLLSIYRRISEYDDFYLQGLARYLWLFSLDPLGLVDLVRKCQHLIRLLYHDSNIIVRRSAGFATI